MPPTTNDFSFPKNSSSLSVMNIFSIGFLIDCIIKLKIKTTCSFYFRKDEITLYFVCFAICSKNVCSHREDSFSFDWDRSITFIHRCERVPFLVHLKLWERN
jgi:hypothetical protein